MHSAANGFFYERGEKEIKQVHVISSSRGEKGGEWGRETRGEEGRRGLRGAMVTGTEEGGEACERSGME